MIYIVINIGPIAAATLLGLAIGLVVGLAVGYFIVQAALKGKKQSLLGEANTKAEQEIRKAQEIIEHRFGERISVDELADQVAIGRRSFERRFKRVTNNSVLEYIQRVKIEAAKRSFESSLKNINEVMFDVGYTDSKAFRTTFKKVTGLTPSYFKNMAANRRKPLDQV